MISFSATTAFGLEPDSLKNPDSKFSEMGRKFFELSFKNLFMFSLKFAAPGIPIALKLHTMDKKLTEYFLSILKKTFEFRRNNKYSRNDFVQLCLQMQENSAAAEREIIKGTDSCQRVKATQVFGKYYSYPIHLLDVIIDNNVNCGAS